uniref:Leucine-rich repeat-containing protein DDB_G0290503 n=1 Tax=Actinia tenebrosa TaxID=6105 RepID=A0A6P8IJV8_ACTTE
MSEPETSSEGIPAQSDLTCSFERSVQAADSTLKQLATTKETFSNFEAFYKKFVAELNEVHEEHHLELYNCQTKIDDLLKEKAVIEEQFRISRKQTRKYKEELAAVKRKQAEAEWENEKKAREISALTVTSERLKTEKKNLELEVASLMKKLGSTGQLRSLTAAKEEENSMLDVVKQEVEQLESSYRVAMEEKEALHVDIVSLQKHMAELQTEYKNNEKELQTQTQNANVKAYKAEMQLKNITRQKETLASQLEECQKELRKAKDRCLALERQKGESQEMAESYKDEINVKRRQIETLNDLNQTLENKLDTMTKELCIPEAASELLASQDESLIQDLELSESKIQDLEKSLQTTRNENQDLERDVIISRNKITGLEESNQRLQEEIRELERHLKVARDNASTLETELFKQTNRYSQLQGELNQLREQENDLQSQLIDSNQRNTEMERHLEQALEENEEVKENALLADRKIDDLIELLKRSEDSNNQLEEKISALKNQMSKIEGQNESNIKQIAKLKTEVDNERGKKKKVEKELLVVTSRLDEAQRGMERINRENEIKERFSGELKKVKKTNEEKLQNLNEKLGKLEAKLEVTEEEKRDLHQVALDLQNRIKELEADNNLCVQEKDRLDLDIEQLCKKINGLQSNLNVCEHERHEFEHQAALLQQKVKKYEAELSEIMKNNADLEAKIQQAISSTCQSNDEIAELKRQVNEYKRAADEIGREVAKKDKQLEKLREKIMAVTAYSETVQDELGHTKSLLQTRDKEKNELEEHFRLINNEVKRVKDMESVATKRKEQLEGEVEWLRGKLQGMEKDVGKSRDAKLMKQLEHERAKVNENQKEVDSLKSKIDSLETEADVSKKDVHAVTEDLQVAEETILNLSCNLERSLEEKNEETRRSYLLENSLKDMEKELHLSRTMKEDAEEEVCAAKKKIAQLESKVDALDKSRSLIKDQLDAVNDDLMNKKEEIMRLQSKITEQVKTNEYLNHVISKKDHVIQESRDRVWTCEADLDEVRRKLRDNQVTAEGLKAENVEYEKRFLLYQENIRKMERDLFKEREANDTLNHQKSAQTLQVNNLQNEINSLRKKRDHYKNEYENAQGSIRRAKQGLLTANHRIREKEVSSVKNLMEMKEKENAISRLRESNIALETELICAKTDLETLRRHFEQSQEKMKELEQSLEEAGVITSRTLKTTMNTVDIEEKDDMDGDSGDVSAKGSRTQSGERVIKEKINGNQKQVSVKDEKILSLNRRIFDMESELLDLKREKDKIESNDENLEKENRELKRELLDAKGKMSDLEVKLKYEYEEKALAESLLNDSRKRTNEMQEKLLKLQQQIVEIQLVNEIVNESEKMERKYPVNQGKAGKYVHDKKVEKVDNENVLFQKDLTEHEESNDTNIEKEKELLSETHAKVSKWESLYEITKQRKSELEKVITNLQNKYELLRGSQKETLGELERAKEDVKTMSNRCDDLELQLEKAVKSKGGLEKQLEEREMKLGILEDRVGEACLKLEEAQRESQKQSKEKIPAAEAIESYVETCTSPLLKNTEKAPDRNSGTIVFEENLPNIERQEEGILKKEEKLAKEIEELRVNNEELKKEIYHLQARETLGKIQKASHKNVMRKLGENESHEENEEMESQESDLSSIKMAYNTLINDILKLSEHLQNYQLNVFEWEDNHDLIVVANERLLSCFSALQALFSDLDASFKELNESISVSDSNSDRVHKSLGSNNETIEKQMSGKDITENGNNGNLENNLSDDNVANLRDEIYRLKRDNIMLKECNEKLLKTVKELEKKAHLIQEEPQETETLCTVPTENVIQTEQGMELYAFLRDEGQREVCGTFSSYVGPISHAGDRYSKADVVCSISIKDVTSKDGVTEKYVTSKEDVTNKDDVTIEEDVTSKDDVICKENVTNKAVVTSKENVTNKDEESNKEDEGNKDVINKDNLFGDQNDREGRMPKDSYLSEKDNEVVGEKEKWLELELTSAKRKIKELESLLQSSTTTLDGRSELVRNHKNWEIGKSKEEIIMNENENVNEKSSDKKDVIHDDSTTAHLDGDSESVKDDKNVGNGKSKEVMRVNENVEEKENGKPKKKKVGENNEEGSSGKKDVIQELQEQNQELISEVKNYMDYKERVDALIRTLRKQVATLQKELEKYRTENLFDFKTRKNEEFFQSPIPKEFSVPTRRFFSDNKGKSSPRLRNFPVRYDRTASSIPSTNSNIGDVRAMSTPNPDREMEFEQGFLPEISSLNLTEDISDKVEATLEASTADEKQDLSLRQNDSVSENVYGNEKEDDESSLAGSCHTKNNNSVKHIEQEKQDAVDEKQHEQDKSIENEFPSIGNKESQFARQQASRSRDQEVSGPSDGRNDFRSSVTSIPNRSAGLGVVPAYIGQITGRRSYRANKSASRTYPFTRKYV